MDWIWYAATVIVVLILVVRFVMLFCLAPRKTRPEAKTAAARDFAHRGLWDDTRPENSLAAFAAAAEAGFAIELDVRLTRDQQLVVHHDPDTSRLCRETLEVANTDADALTRLTLGGTDAHVPLFSDVLACVRGRVPLLIEIKTPTLSADAVCARVCEALENYDGAWCMESFNPFALRWFKKNRPDVVRGQLACRARESGRSFGTRVQHWIAARLLGNAFSRPDFIAYRMSDLPFRPVKRFAHLYPETPLVAWTLDTREDFDNAAKRFDGRIFERVRP